MAKREIVSCDRCHKKNIKDHYSVTVVKKDIGYAVTVELCVSCTNALDVFIRRK